MHVKQYAIKYVYIPEIFLRVRDNYVYSTLVGLERAARLGYAVKIKKLIMDSVA